MQDHLPNLILKKSKQGINHPEAWNWESHSKVIVKFWVQLEVQVGWKHSDKEIIELSG